jgi:hypothetical protein
MSSFISRKTIIARLTQCGGAVGGGAQFRIYQALQFRLLLRRQ